MDDIVRFYPHQWDQDAYGWSVCETPGGGWEGKPHVVITWLTKEQAEVVADFLNDAAGYDWQKRHPDWFALAKEVREKYPPSWKA